MIGTGPNAAWTFVKTLISRFWNLRRGHKGFFAHTATTEDTHPRIYMELLLVGWFDSMNGSSVE